MKFQKGVIVGVKMKRTISFLTLMIFLLLSVTALDDFGVYKNGENVRITQVCSDATYINLTSISYPNSSTARSNVAMTLNGGDYYFDFNDTSLNGRYDVRGISDGCEGEFATYFIITPNGELISTPKVSFYIFGIILLMIMFILSLMGIFIFEDYKAKFTLYWICHLLFVAISFIGWDFSIDYLTDTNFIEGMFKILFYFSTIAIFPMVILSVVFVFYIHLMNDDIKKMMDRGMDEGEAYDRSRRKKRW